MNCCLLLNRKKRNHRKSLSSTDLTRAFKKINLTKKLNKRNEFYLQIGRIHYMYSV